MNKYQEAKETLEKYDYSTKLELSEGIKNTVKICKMHKRRINNNVRQ